MVTNPEDNDYILLVEDEIQVQKKNKRILERSGYNIRQAFNLGQARTIIKQSAPLVIILDIGLPDGNGLSFLQELRETSNIPVLILTAMGTNEDIIRGFEQGSDDYLTKPYDLKVFLARIEALLRRARLVPETITIGPIRLNTVSWTAFLDEEDLMLSKKEYSMLQLFMQHPEITLSSDLIYDRVWGQETPENPDALKTIISRVRRKLDGSGYTITAERGEGYVFEQE